jgi:hypothetical protein
LICGGHDLEKIPDEIGDDCDVNASIVMGSFSIREDSENERFVRQWEIIRVLVIELRDAPLLARDFDLKELLHDDDSFDLRTVIFRDDAYVDLQNRCDVVVFDDVRELLKIQNLDYHFYDDDEVVSGEIYVLRNVPFCDVKYWSLLILKVLE